MGQASSQSPTSGGGKAVEGKNGPNEEVILQPPRGDHAVNVVPEHPLLPVVPASSVHEAAPLVMEEESNIDQSVGNTNRKFFF